MKRDRGWWPFLTLFPFGWANWAAFLVAGVRANSTRWKLWAAVYALGAIAPWVLDAILPKSDDNDAYVGLLLLGVWGAGIVHAFVVRSRYLELVNGRLETSREAAEERIEARREALRIAEESPELAREMGIGRPGGPGGLVDVNWAPGEQLERLPGIDAATAARIVELRRQVGEFSSLADLGMTAELDAAVVEDLRGRVIFL
jgi:SARP family transcriptional regulator, regulator of embCAB operon